MSIPYCIIPHYMQWFSWYYEKVYTIRLSIFLIIGVCVGFPALICAFGVLYRHYKSRRRISTIAIFLLLSDLLELFLNPLIVAYISKKKSAVCMFEILIGARFCGHQLHQLVALESILTLKYRSFVPIFSPSCSITLCSVVWLVGIVCQLLFIDSYINMFLCVLPVIVCAITCIVTCKASPATNQATDRKPGVLVLSVAIFTLFILYVPFFLTIFAGLPFMLDSLVSMRLISDPLLCVLICRETHMIETAHTETDHTW